MPARLGLVFEDPWVGLLHSLNLGRPLPATSNRPIPEAVADANLVWTYRAKVQRKARDRSPANSQEKLPSWPSRTGQNQPSGRKIWGTERGR